MSKFGRRDQDQGPKMGWDKKFLIGVCAVGVLLVVGRLLQQAMAPTPPKPVAVASEEGTYDPSVMEGEGTGEEAAQGEEEVPYNVVREPVKADPEKAKKFVFKSFFTALKVERGAKVKIFETASGVVPAGYKGFLRNYPTQYKTEDGSAVKMRLHEAQYNDFISPQFRTIPTIEQGDKFIVKVGDPLSDPLRKDTLRKYDLLLEFDAAIGKTKQGNECILWMLSPYETPVSGGVEFEVILPPGLPKDGFAAEFFLGDRITKSRKRLTYTELGVKTTQARAEDSAGGERYMLSGRYANAKDRLEDVIVKLTWSPGFSITDGKVIEAAIKDEPEVEETPEPTEPAEVPEEDVADEE